MNIILLQLHLLTLRLAPLRILSIRAERASGLGGATFSTGIIGGTGDVGISIGGGGGGGGGALPGGGGGATGLDTIKTNADHMLGCCL